MTECRTRRYRAAAGIEWRTTGGHGPAAISRLTQPSSPLVPPLDSSPQNLRIRLAENAVVSASGVSGKLSAFSIQPSAFSDQLARKDLRALTAAFPRQERYGLTSQLRRCSSSIPANLAEGCGRNGDAEFAGFCSIAIGVGQRAGISPAAGQRFKS